MKNVRVRYYLAYGSNGCIIIRNNYYKALEYRYFLRQMNVKKFDTYKEAEEAALEHLSDTMPYYFHLPEHIPVDKFYSFLILKRMNESGEL